MGKKNQEMSQVYNGSKNEFIFGEGGGKGKHLSSFLKNLSLTGSRSNKTESYQDINSNIYGNLSYNRGETESIGSGESFTRVQAPRSVSIGGDYARTKAKDGNSRPGYNGNRSSSSVNIKSQRRTSGNVRYNDLDDDWDAGFEEVASKPKPNMTRSASHNVVSSKLKSSPKSTTSVFMDPFYPDLTIPASITPKEQSPVRKFSESTMDDYQARLEMDKLNHLNSRIVKFRNVLLGEETNINIAELRKLSWNGIPSELRAISWQALLGYLPTNRSRQSSTLNRKRQEYLDGLKQMNVDFEDDPSNMSNTSLSSVNTTGQNSINITSTATTNNNNNNNVREKQLYHQIKIDVKRTNPTIKFYGHLSTQMSLRKILYIWAVRHPASGYVQGINDLVTPFYQIFVMNYIWQLQRKKLGIKGDYDLFIPGLLDENDPQEQELLKDENLLSYTVENFDPAKISPRIVGFIEADTYWCFSRLLETITDNYIHEQPGIIRQVGDLRNLISKIDVELINHFDNEGIEFIQFSFRWMNCLLMRELNIDLIIRMWDTYLSETPIGFNNFHIYVCAAFLIKFSPELKQKDFQEILLFLQNPPTSSWTDKDIELMLSEAFIWQSLYKNASAHLR